MLLVSKHPEMRDRMRNIRNNYISTYACFSALNDAEGLMSIEKNFLGEKGNHNVGLSWK